MARTRLIALLLCGSAALLAPRAQADAIADLQKYSVFTQVDLSSLAGGKVVTDRGPSMGNGRDLSVQALYLIHAPVARTLALHQSWDAGKHPELKVYVHHDFSSHPSPADFAVSVPGNSAVRRLTAATEKLPSMGELQLSKDEAASFKNAGGSGAFPPSVQSFWSQVLLRRATAFLQHGLSGEPAYDTGEGSIHVSAEVSRLLSEQPKVRAAFRPIIGASPLGGSGAGGVLPYWELFDVEGVANFSLGAAAAIQSSASAQMADFQYYASGGYFTFITLYQMWAVTVNGKPATLVWRVDSLSSSSLADLGPFDKMGSGVAMQKDVQRIVQFFQRDVGR